MAGRVFMTPEFRQALERNQGVHSLEIDYELDSRTFSVRVLVAGSTRTALMVAIRKRHPEVTIAQVQRILANLPWAENGLTPIEAAELAKEYMTAGAIVDIR